MKAAFASICLESRGRVVVVNTICDRFDCGFKRLCGSLRIK